MSKDIKRKGLQSEERRRFMELSAKFGVTTAIVALASCVLGSREASARVAGEEQERKKSGQLYYDCCYVLCSRCFTKLPHHAA